MPVLLLIPLLVLVVVALWALLLPVSLWARYRAGRARRRAQGWVIRANAWLLGVSCALYLLSAWIASNWVGHALRDAALGGLAGIGVGIVGLWLTRFEHDDAGFHFTPNRWLVLALTMLVAARIAAGLWLAWRSSGAPTTAWLQAGSLFGVGGLLLGYYLAYTWGLRARLPARGHAAAPRGRTFPDRFA
jgi:hypothetical protein